MDQAAGRTAPGAPDQRDAGYRRRLGHARSQRGDELGFVVAGRSAAGCGLWSGDVCLGFERYLRSFAVDRRPAGRCPAGYRHANPGVVALRITAGGGLELGLEHWEGRSAAPVLANGLQQLAQKESRRRESAAGRVQSFAATNRAIPQVAADGNDLSTYRIMSRSNLTTLVGAGLALMAGVVFARIIPASRSVQAGGNKPPATAANITTQNQPESALGRVIRTEKGAKRWLVLLAQAEKADAAKIPSLIRSAGDDS